MKILKDIFNDKITIAAGIAFCLIVVLVLFTAYSHLPEQYPLFGFVIFLTIPVIFVIGGLIFAVAILRS
ncbi:hypothetical protein ACFLYV_01370 [Chloroflexota bacterium]